MFEHFIISDHVLERYAERIDGSKTELERRIRKDLSIGKIKYIFNIGKCRYIFCEYGKEFVFQRIGKTWILKTIIKRTRKQNERALRRYRKMTEEYKKQKGAVA